ncbi:MAG: hypothetical protein WD875_18135 [Pirellulales bacterium]
MHAAELVELAALLTSNGPALLADAAQPASARLDEYWTASKCRLDRWLRTLADFRRLAEQAARRPTTADWSRLWPVAEEILTGEILTRVWAALMTAGDCRRGVVHGEPIARSILLGHMEARNRVLNLVVHGAGIERRHAIAINRLRRRCDRWTDLLIGYLIQLHDVSALAPNPDRARDFADDLRFRQQTVGGRHAWPLVLASLRAGMVRGFAERSPNGDLNARIAASVLASISPLAFDSTGVMRSLWMVRISTTATDTEGMIAELIRADAPAQLPLLDRGSAHGLGPAESC